jgi:hypothetical protein
MHSIWNNTVSGSNTPAALISNHYQQLIQQNNFLIYCSSAAFVQYLRKN